MFPPRPLRWLWVLPTCCGARSVPPSQCSAELMRGAQDFLRGQRPMQRSPISCPAVSVFCSQVGRGGQLLCELP